MLLVRTGGRIVHREDSYEDTGILDFELKLRELGIKPVG